MGAWDTEGRKGRRKGKRGGRGGTRVSNRLGTENRLFGVQDINAIFSFRIVFFLQAFRIKSDKCRSAANCRHRRLLLPWLPQVVTKRAKKEGRRKKTAHVPARHKHVYNVYLPMQMLSIMMIKKTAKARNSQGISSFRAHISGMKRQKTTTGFPV